MLHSLVKRPNFHIAGQLGCLPDLWRYRVVDWFLNVHGIELRTGEIIGLPSTLSAKPYELTAEVQEPTQANFICREDFLAFLRQHGETALRVAEMLSNIYYATCREVRYLGLSNSAVEKLARFLLDLKPANNGEPPDSRVILNLTHEEIAGMIGTSRETVTRHLSSFKRQGFIQVHGSTLVIVKKEALQQITVS